MARPPATKKKAPSAVHWLPLFYDIDSRFTSDLRWWSSTCRSHDQALIVAIIGDCAIIQGVYVGAWNVLSTVRKFKFTKKQLIHYFPEPINRMKMAAGGGKNGALLIWFLLGRVHELFCYHNYCTIRLCLYPDSTCCVYRLVISAGAWMLKSTATCVLLACMPFVNWTAAPSRGETDPAYVLHFSTLDGCIWFDRARFTSDTACMVLPR